MTQTQDRLTSRLNPVANYSLRSVSFLQQNTAMRVAQNAARLPPEVTLLYYPFRGIYSVSLRGAMRCVSESKKNWLMTTVGRALGEKTV